MSAPHLSQLADLAPFAFALLSSSLKAAAFYLAAFIAVALSRKRSAAARHRLWTAASFGALLVPLASAFLSLSRDLLRIDATVTLPAPFALVVPASSSGVAGVVGAVSRADSGVALPAVLVAAWALGVVVVLTRLARSHLAARVLVRSSSPCALQAAGADVRVSDHVSAPMTIGVVRGTILVPREMLAWSEEAARAILVHESAHVARRDNAAQLVAALACAVHWWNPLAWYAARRMRIERELACDDAVLARGMMPPSSYAQALVDLARKISSSNATASPDAPASSACAVEPAGVAARVEHILSTRSRTFSVSAHLGAVVLLAASSSFAVAALSSARDPSAGERPLEEIVRAALGDPEACFPRSATEPDAPSSYIVHWTVDDDGKTAESCVTRDELKDAAAGACIARLLEHARFDDALRGTSLEVAFYPTLRARLMSRGDVLTPDDADLPAVPFLLQRPSR